MPESGCASVLVEKFRYNSQAARLRERGLPVLPVRMKVGSQAPRGSGGFGFLHTLRHAADMMEAAKASPLQYFYMLSRHIVGMRDDAEHTKKNRRANAYGITGDKKGKLVIELRPNVKAYTVISMHPRDMERDAESEDELQNAAGARSLVNYGIRRFPRQG